MGFDALTNRWLELNNRISEEEIFDYDEYKPLYDDTEKLILEIKGKESFSKAEIKLLLELARFCGKEILDEIQYEESEKVYALIYYTFLRW